MNTYGVVKDIAKFDMSAKNTTIYIFVVFSDVCRLEILVSVSSLLPSENSIAGIGFSDSQADPIFWRLQSRRMECGRIYISHPQACQQISPSDFCACTGFFLCLGLPTLSTTQV